MYKPLAALAILAFSSCTRVSSDTASEKLSNYPQGTALFNLDKVVLPSSVLVTYKAALHIHKTSEAKLATDISLLTMDVLKNKAPTIARSLKMTVKRKSVRQSLFYSVLGVAAYSLVPEHPTPTDTLKTFSLLVSDSKGVVHEVVFLVLFESDQIEKFNLLIDNDPRQSVIVRWNRPLSFWGLKPHTDIIGPSISPGTRNIARLAIDQLRSELNARQLAQAADLFQHGYVGVRK